VRTTTAPELPDAAVPLLNNSEPDVPDEAAFEVATVMEPVVALLLPPAMIDTEPPVCEAAVVAPADRTRTPPLPLLPVPTATLIAPPLPLVANPDTIVTVPLLPSNAVPLLSNTDPDVPADAALDVATVMEPVVALLLPPAMIDTDPPVCEAAVVAPADSTRTPPLPLLPVPTATLMAPPLPLVANPDTMVTVPLLPLNAVPLLNSSEPDVPADAALDVATVMEPVVALLLPPARIDTEPPVCDAAVVEPPCNTTAPPTAPRDCPADNSKAPPNVVPLPTVRLIPPPFPAVADPVCSQIEPEFPTAAVPVDKRTDPEVPSDAASTV